jgi:hypothetical protein
MSGVREDNDTVLEKVGTVVCAAVFGFAYVG